MALRSPGSRRRVGRSERTVVERSGTTISPDLDRQCFEFDRGIVAGVLGTLRGAINEGAAQMEMVAEERMFDQSLSGTFSRTAQHLERMARRLGKLLDEVTDAHGYPKMAVAAPVRRIVARGLTNRQR